MDNHSQLQHTLNFNRTCFAATNGWYPVRPATEQLALGDFGLMQQGRFVVLGNLFEISLAQPIVVSELPLDLNDGAWQFQSGVRHNVERLRTQSSEHSAFASAVKHQLIFERPDSYLFSSREPVLSLISNWGQLQDDVLLKLTQTAYGFKQVMVVTSVVRFVQWGLAMPAGLGAELEIVTQPVESETPSSSFMSEFTEDALLAQPNSMVTQSSAMAVLCRGNLDSAQFFRAYKLILSGQKQDEVTRSILEDRNMSDSVKGNWLNGNLFDRLIPGAININNCIDSLAWVEAGLDDLQG